MLNIRKSCLAIILSMAVLVIGGVKSANAQITPCIPTSTSYTSNLSLTLPGNCTLNAGVLLNSNFSAIDVSIANLQAAFKGPWSGTIVYNKGQQVVYNSTLYVSAINSNFDNIPGTGSQWTSIFGVGGALTPTSVLSTFTGAVGSCYGLEYPVSSPVTQYELVSLGISGVSPAGTSGAPVMGVAQSTVSSGSVNVCTLGQTSVIMDGSSIAGHVAVPSTSVGGDATDSNAYTSSSNVPLTSGDLGLIKTGCAGSGCVAVINLRGAFQFGRSLAGAGVVTLTSGTSGQLAQVTGSATLAGIAGTSISGSGISQSVSYPGSISAGIFNATRSVLAWASAAGPQTQTSSLLNWIGSFTTSVKVGDSIMYGHDSTVCALPYSSISTCFAGISDYALGVPSGAATVLAVSGDDTEDQVYRLWNTFTPALNMFTLIELGTNDMESVQRNIYPAPIYIEPDLIQQYESIEQFLSIKPANFFPATSCTSQANWSADTYYSSHPGCQSTTAGATFTFGPYQYPVGGEPTALFYRVFNPSVANGGQFTVNLMQSTTGSGGAYTKVGGATVATTTTSAPLVFNNVTTYTNSTVFSVVLANSGPNVAVPIAGDWYELQVNVASSTSSSNIVSILGAGFGASFTGDDPTTYPMQVWRMSIPAPSYGQYGIWNQLNSDWDTATLFDQMAGFTINKIDTRSCLTGVQSYYTPGQNHHMLDSGHALLAHCVLYSLPTRIPPPIVGPAGPANILGGTIAGTVTDTATHVASNAATIYHTDSSAITHLGSLQQFDSAATTAFPPTPTSTWVGPGLAGAGHFQDIIDSYMGASIASYTGTISTTGALTVSGVTGTISTGLVVGGVGVTNGTTIISGSGLNWVVSPAPVSTVGPEAMTGSPIYQDKLQFIQSSNTSATVIPTGINEAINCSSVIYPSGATNTNGCLPHAFNYSLPSGSTFNYNGGLPIFNSTTAQPAFSYGTTGTADPSAPPVGGAWLNITSGREKVNTSTGVQVNAYLSDIVASTSPSTLFKINAPATNTGSTANTQVVNTALIPSGTIDSTGGIKVEAHAAGCSGIGLPFAACTGITSITGISGGSGFSGTGTLFLTAFNNSCSGSTVTVTITSGAFTSALVTATGTGCTANPTSATCTSGTATCTGSPVSITVVGVAGANAGTCTLRIAMATTNNGSTSQLIGATAVPAGKTSVALISARAQSSTTSQVVDATFMNNGSASPQLSLVTSFNLGTTSLYFNAFLQNSLASDICGVTEEDGIYYP